MEYKRYITRKRAKFDGLSGPVNIPYGTALENEGGFLMWKGGRVCLPTSQNALDHFCQDDDGQGQQRGDLITRILSRMEKRNRDHKARWEKVRSNPLTQKYRRVEHEDFWIWNHDFYTAPVEDLRQIAALIGA